MRGVTVAADTQPGGLLRAPRRNHYESVADLDRRIRPPAGGKYRFWLRAAAKIDGHGKRDVTSRRARNPHGPASAWHAAPMHAPSSAARCLPAPREARADNGSGLRRSRSRRFRISAHGSDAGTYQHARLGCCVIIDSARSSFEGTALSTAQTKEIFATLFCVHFARRYHQGIHARRDGRRLFQPPHDIAQPTGRLAHCYQQRRDRFFWLAGLKVHAMTNEMLLALRQNLQRTVI